MIDRLLIVPTGKEASAAEMYLREYVFVDIISKNRKCLYILWASSV